MAGLSSSSPFDAARLEAIDRTTDTILAEQTQRKAAQAATVLRTARAGSVNPETAARSNALRDTTALQTNVYDPGLLDTLEGRVAERREMDTLKANPRTAGFFLDYQNAVAAPDAVEEVGGIEGLFNSFLKRADTAIDNFTTTREIDFLNDVQRHAIDGGMSFDEILAEERIEAAEEQAQVPSGGRRARKRGEVTDDGQAEDGLRAPFEFSARAQALWRYVKSGPSRMFSSEERLQEVEQLVVDDIEGALNSMAVDAQDREMMLPSHAFRREIDADIGDIEDETLGGTIAGMFQIAKEKPGRFMYYMLDITAESGATLAVSLGVGAATRSPGAAVATMGATSYEVSQGMYFQELVDEYGYDLTTEHGRRRLAEDPRVIRDLRDKSKAYGIVVGVIDAASGGVASKTLVDNPVGNMLLQTIVQGTMGGGGEALGRLASGEAVDWKEVVIEALAETVSAPLEVAGMGYSAARTKVKKAADQKRQKKLFDILAGKVDTSTLRKRDKATFQAAIKAVTEDGPSENVHVDPAQIEEMFQDEGMNMSVEEFFDAVPELSYEDYVEALNNGSQYTIPTSVYATHIAGTELDTKMRQHIKLRAEDMSEAEVKTFQEDLAQTQADLQQNTDKLETVIGTLEGPLAQEMERLRGEIVQAHGIRPQDAERQAAVLVSSARAGAVRSGLPIAEYLRRYTLPAVRNADTVGPGTTRNVIDPQIVLSVINGDVEASDAVLPDLAAIKDRLDRNGVDEGNASADDIQAAVQELIDEGEITADLPDADAARPGTTEKPDGEEMMQTATLRGGEEDASEWGIDTSKKNKTRDIAIKLQERQRKLYGKTNKNQRGPKTVDKLAEWMADELEFELQTPERAAVGWYGPKFQAALDKLGDVWQPLVDDQAAADSQVPGVETVEDARALATALFAVSSNGTKVIDNVSNALTVLLELESEGTLANIGHRAAIGDHMQTMIDLAAEMGGVGMQEHLTREMPMRDINKEIKAAGGNAKGGYPADMVVPYAARYLGPKLAAFYANLTGADGYLTMDLWWTRSIRRYQGDVLPRVRGMKNEVNSKGQPVGLHRFKHLIGRPDLTDSQALNHATEHAEAYAKKGFKNGTEAERAANTIHKDANVMLDEQPGGAKDREFMIKIAQAAREKLFDRIGVRYSIADVQAMLWYYEKRLYAEMGVRDSGDLSYEEAAEAVVKKHARELVSGEQAFEEAFAMVPEVQRMRIEKQREAEARERNMTIQELYADEFFQGGDNEITTGTITDMENQPVTLYHGTNQLFKTFKGGRIFFTNKQSLAREHAIRSGFQGARVVEATVALQNELRVEVPGNEPTDIHWLNNALKIEEQMAAGGHDGVMIYNEEGELLVIATTNDQIAQLNMPDDSEFFQEEQPWQPLTDPLLPGLEKASPGRVVGVRELATWYMRDNDLPVRHQAEYVKVDQERARRIAQLYDEMEDNPNDPEVKAAYEALAAETIAQYEYLLKLGYTFEWITGKDPYDTPADAIRDMQENKHLWVFPTDEGFGTLNEASADNPLLAETDFEIDGRRAKVNDLFRIVHDVFGHGSEGASFGARGEENAWQAHVRMFSPLAARAMTTETRGQNSWVNFGPYGEQNRADPANTVFADQKVGLLPEWVSTEGIGEDRTLPEPATGVPHGSRPVSADMIDPKNLRDMTPEEQLAVFNRPGWYVVTAAINHYGENTSAENEARNDTLRQRLADLGRTVFELEGVYQGEPDGTSFLVLGDEAEGYSLASEFGQESVLTRNGLEYTDGSGRENVPFSGITYGHAAKREDFHSRFKDGLPIDNFSLHLDFPEPTDVTVDDGDGSSHYGARVEDGKIKLTHWSTTQLGEIDPNLAGTGQLPGPERKRRGPKKSFYGMHVGQKGGYKRESHKLGRYRHEVLIDPREMYPWWEDPDGLKDKIDRKLPQPQQMGQYEELIKAAGYKGYFVIGGPLGDAAVMFEAATPTTVDEEAYFQKAMGNAPNGSIILPKEPTEQAIIQLFEKANMTTMLHETGHFFLWQLQKQSADGLEFAQNEMEVVKSWFRSNAEAIAEEAKRHLPEGTDVPVGDVLAFLETGAASHDDLSAAIHRAMHEQFARGFEAYALEGKSPSNALRAIFESFASWLLAWYKSAKALNVDINDDIRGVFDRMLVVEEELMTAADREAINDGIAETAKEMGLDEASYQRLVALSGEAREEGRQLARKELMETERRMRSREYQARYAEIEAEERERINSEPVHRAIQWLAYGRWLGDDRPEGMPLELRLDPELLVDDFGEDVIHKLPRGRRPIHKKDTGLSADEVSGWFGFDGGAEMIDAMIKAPKANEAVKAATEARVQKELGDPMADTDEMATHVADAFHGEKRGQVIVAELRAINRIGGKKGKMTTRAQAKAIARDLISRMPVREAIQTSRYLAAERKHAEDATRSMAAGDVDAAFTSKRKQLIQHELYIESRKAAELVGKAERLSGRLKRKGTRENLAPEYLGAIDDILMTYDFRKITGKAENLRARLNAYVDGMKAAGREGELAIPKHVLEEARRIPYKQLSVRRLQGVYDSLKNIEHTARRLNKVRLAQQEREMQEVRNEIGQAFEDNINGKPLNRVPTWVDKKRDGIKGYFNMVRNADTILRKIDGWANRGVMVRYFKEDIDRAGVRAKELRDQATEDLDRLFSGYTQNERRQMSKRVMWDGFDQGLSKWDIISIALNMGNKDNLERLTSRDSAGALTQAQVDALVENLDKRDWDFVQSVWDHLDKNYWPMIADREERTTGVRPQKVEAQPVQTQFGEYRGGYYPIVYDARYSAKVSEDQNRDLMLDMMAGRFGKAQTKNGHTKERGAGGGGRTVQLGMHVLFGHVNHVIHDLAYGEAVNTTWKLLQDPQIKGRFEQNNMLKDHEALELWVQDVAAGPSAGTHVLAGTMRRMKSGFTLSKLAFNMSTVAIQVTGLTQSMALLGSGNMAKGINTYLFSKRGRYGLAQDIKERSTFMREREETFQRDAYDMYRDTQLDPMGGVLSDTQKLIMGAGFFAMQKVQYYTVDVPTWLAAHQKGIADGMTDSQAADFADRMVARAQASGLYADRTAVERGTMGRTHRQNEFLRLFTALGSYMFAKYNVAEEIVGRTGNAIRDPNQSTVMAVLKATTDLVLLFVIEAILYNMVKGALPGMEGNDDEDEGWLEFLAEETALSVASIFPFIRDVPGVVQGYGGGGAYGGITETIGRALASAGDLVTGEATTGDLRSLNDMGGLMVPGYPSTAVWRLIDGGGLTGEDPSALSMILGR